VKAIALHRNELAWQGHSEPGKPTL